LTKQIRIRNFIFQSIFEKEKIYINESDYYCDIHAETKDRFTVYAEIKSISDSYDLYDKLSIYISPNQWNFLQQADEKNINVLPEFFQPIQKIQEYLILVIAI
jgi:hypothetical protein